jgi:hypothetical protein
MTFGVGHFQNDCVPKVESRGDSYRNPLAIGVNQCKGRVEFFFSFLLMIPAHTFQVPYQLFRFGKNILFLKVPKF